MHSILFPINSRNKTAKVGRKRKSRQRRGLSEKNNAFRSFNRSWSRMLIGRVYYLTRSRCSKRRNGDKGHARNWRAQRNYVRENEIASSIPYATYDDPISRGKQSRSRSGRLISAEVAGESRVRKIEREDPARLLKVPREDRDDHRDNRPGVFRD